MGFECSGVIEAVGEGVTQFEASRVELQCTQMHPTLLFALSNAR
jgi:threonine dehydrogenase-like Zn-dependent dehydrogenase